jgi:6-phosphogluconolactonase (cycloisomerase 2 family)
MKYQFAGGFRPDGTVQFNPTHGTAISPDRKWLWVCSRATNTAYIYSLSDLKLANKLEMPVIEKAGQPVQAADPHWAVLTHNGKKIYICLAAIDQVIAFDTHTLKEVSRFDVGTRPTVIEIAHGM